MHDGKEIFTSDADQEAGNPDGSWKGMSVYEKDQCGCTIGNEGKITLCPRFDTQKLTILQRLLCSARREESIRIASRSTWRRKHDSAGYRMLSRPAANLSNFYRQVGTSAVSPSHSRGKELEST